MKNLAQDISDKLGTNGSKTIKDIADQLNKYSGRGIDIGRTKAPLNESGTTLPTIKKVKGK